jgi:hypothetical protein
LANQLYPRWFASDACLFSCLIEQSHICICRSSIAQLASLGWVTMSSTGGVNRAQVALSSAIFLLIFCGTIVLSGDGLRILEFAYQFLPKGPLWLSTWESAGSTTTPPIVGDESRFILDPSWDVNASPTTRVYNWSEDLSSARISFWSSDDLASSSCIRSLGSARCDPETNARCEWDVPGTNYRSQLWRLHHSEWPTLLASYLFEHSPSPCVAKRVCRR